MGYRPPLISTFLIVVSLLCLLSALLHVVHYGAAPRGNRSRLAFASLAFAASASVLPTLLLLHSHSVEDVRSALKMDLAIFIPLFLNLLWFADLYAGRAGGKIWVLLTAAGAGLWGIHLLRPYGLLTGGVVGYTALVMPWGEKIHLLEMTPSPGAIAYYLFLAAGLARLIRRSIQVTREKDKGVGRALFFCVALGVLLAAHDLLVDFGVFPGLYLGVLAVPLLVVLLSVEFDLERSRQERLFAALFDSLNEAVLVHDPGTTRILSVNGSAVRMFGYEKEEFSRLQWKDLGEPEAHGFEEAFRRFRSKIDPVSGTLEWRARRKDGGVFWAEATLREVDLRGGPKVVAVVRDVTERKRSQVDLAESEARFRAVVETSPLGMFFFHLGEGGRLWFDGANRAADRLRGVDHGPLAGKPIEEAFPQLKGSEIERRLYLTAREGVPWHAENMEPREGGWMGAHELFAQPTTSGRLVVLAHDLRQRLGLEEEKRRIQARLQEAQRLESLGVLAGGIAHDLNNLVMAVRGSLEALEACPGRADHTECGRALASIRSTNERTTEWCRQLLAYSGRGSRALSAMDLRRAVEETARLAESNLPQDVRLVYRWAGALPRVKADDAQIRQAILSLLSNAAEAIGTKPGRITISLQPRNLEIPERGLPPGSYLSMEVADDGPGMDAATLERVFDPFFTTKPSGRGLGLAAVQGILRAHGGSIEAASTPGIGTTMTVLLPVAKDPVPAPPGAAGGDAAGFSGRVLLVDDEIEVRRVTRLMLEHLGLTVDEAGNGLEAVERVREAADRYALAVVDLSMPDLDGIEALGRIRVLKPDLPALLVSGYGPEAVQGRLADLPGVSLLPKPFGREELASALASSGVPRDPGGAGKGALDAEAFKIHLARLVGCDPDVGALYQELSRMFLRVPGIHFAWVGLLAPDGSTVVPVVESGDAGDYVRKNMFRADDSVFGRGPTGTSIKTKEPVFVNDVETDPIFSPWRDHAKRAGFAACASLPVLIQGKAVGCLVVYSAQRGFFDDERRAFFRDVCLLLAEGFRRLREREADVREDPR